MKPVTCSEDRIALARQGALSAGEWQALTTHLTTCADCRITWRLMADFEHSAAPQPGDERILERAAKHALAAPLGQHSHVFRVGVAAAVLLTAVGIASGAVLLRARHHAASAGPSHAERPSRDGEAGLCPAEPERGKVWKPSQGFHINDTRARGATSLTPQSLPAEEPTVVPRTEPGPASSSTARQPEARTRRLPRSGQPAGQPAKQPALADARSSPPGSPFEDAATLFARAVGEREQGRTAAAIATFRLLQRRFPGTPEALLSLVSLADLSLGSGDAGAALVAFDAYLDAAPSGVLVPEALLGKARALSVLGRVSEADAVWGEIARRYPDSPYAGQRIRTRTEGAR